MPNYQNTKIYSVRCKTNPEYIYIGFTTLDLKHCWNETKSLYNLKYNIKYFKIISNIDDWYIQLEKHYPCNTKREANEAKEKVIESFDKVLNYSFGNGIINSYYEYNS